MYRRDFILFGLASCVAPVCATSKIPSSKKIAEASSLNSKKLISAFSQYDEYFVGKLDLVTGLLSQQQLPFRAHDAMLLGEDQVLSFGRRPMNQCVFSDLKTQQQKLINSAESRHFYGHGCLDADSKVLFTTENDYENVAGKIGIRDAKTFKQIGEFSSYGIGPHDIHLMPDRKTLVIANGGIQTHPDYGRRKLNLKTMQPSLVLIDSQSGKKVDEYRLNNHHLSIRHLVVTDDGRIGVSTQFQGNLYRDVPETLLAWFDGNSLKQLSTDKKVVKQCQGYIADVAVDMNNEILAATSPRGNNVSFWDIKDKVLIDTIEIPEPSGIIFDSEKRSFLVSNANGDIHQISQNHSKFLANLLQGIPGVSWDNHMIMNS